MRLSDFYLKTYKECPLNVTNESLKLLYRSGMLKYFEDASYSYTPLGNLFFDKFISVVLDNFKEYMNIKINGDKVPVLGSYFSDLKSYKDIPFNIIYFTKNKNRYYKFKDGLLNPKKENMIKFIRATSKDNINESVDEINKKINNTLEKLNLKGEIFKDENDNLKYFYKTSYPLRDIIFCEQCGYASLKEDAVSYFEKDLSTEELKDIEYVHTPNVGTIEDLEKFLNISADKLIKTLLFNIKGEVIAVLLRGDRSINLNLLAKTLNVKVSEIKMANEEDVKLATNADIGFAGPIGLNNISKIFADHEVIYIKNGIVGANKTDYHIKNVNYEKDFKVNEIGNFKNIEENHKCFKCYGELKSFDGINFIDVNIFEKNFAYLNSQGREEKLYSVEVNIYTDRLFSLIVEQNNDELGIKWPNEVSYFDYHLIIGNIKNEKELNAGNLIYYELTKKGYNVLLDDRKERIGFKFKDCELIGISNVIVVGKDIENDIIEVRNRITKDSKNISLNDFISVE